MIYGYGRYFLFLLLFSMFLTIPHAIIISKYGMHLQDGEFTLNHGLQLSFEPFARQMRNDFLSYFFYLGGGTEYDAPKSVTDRGTRKYDYRAGGFKINLGRYEGTESFSDLNFYRSLKAGSLYLKGGIESGQFTSRTTSETNSGLLLGVGYERINAGGGFFVEYLHHQASSAHSVGVGFILPFGISENYSSKSLYPQWLDQWDGEFDQLKYTHLTYQADREANRGSSKLAPYSLNDHYSRGMLGNWYLEGGLERLHGFGQAVALQRGATAGTVTAQQAYFKPDGMGFVLGKRISQYRKQELIMRVRHHQATANLWQPDGPFVLVTGEDVDTISGVFDQKMWALDLMLKQPISRGKRCNSEFLWGFRVSDIGLSIDTEGSITIPLAADKFRRQTASHYHYKNIAIGPFLGFNLTSPLTNAVHVKLAVRQGVLPSKSEGSLKRRNLSAFQVILDEELQDRNSTAFPFTEFDIGLNYFHDRSTRIHFDYGYAHWHLPKIIAFGNQEFRNISWQGPKVAIDFLF